MEKIFSGSAPANDGTELITLAKPKEKYPIPEAPERPEEFSPGLDPELQELADALVVAKEKVKKTQKNNRSASNN
jgi:Mn-containing catalase